MSALELMFTDPDGNPIDLPDPDCSDAEALAILGSGDLELIGRMPFSSNGTFLCVARGDGADLGAIFKPEQGERPLWDFPEGTLHRREVAAYALSELLGWGIVPPTALVDTDEFGPGSLQRFIAHDPNEHYFTLLEGNEDRFRQFAAFDIVANNTDRKGGHCLRAERDGRIIGIDQGLTFHPAWKVRTVIWEFGGEELPESLRKDIEAALGGLEAALAPYLSPLEIEATALRTAELLGTGVFPEGSDDARSYPWPLV